MHLKDGNITLDVLPNGTEPGGAGSLFLMLLAVCIRDTSDDRVSIILEKVTQPEAEECFDFPHNFRISTTFYQESATTSDQNYDDEFDTLVSALEHFTHICASIHHCLDNKGDRHATRTDER